jgi:alkylation response protein AidB-like acyl-CoA dehydrogenase
VTPLPSTFGHGYRPPVSSILERARAIADDVLLLSALATDASDLVPVASLDVLAREGFYGLDGPADAGGLDLDEAARQAVIETLASGCLSTTFVWIQHHSGLRAVAGSATPGLRETWLAPMCRGDVRGGIARAGEIPGPPRLRADRTPHGLLLNGEAPWVTGWGRIDVLLVAAREGETVVRALMDATEAPTIEVERLRLVGADASGTFTLRFHDHLIPAERIVEEEPLAAVTARDPMTLRTNGSLALGVASRCCALMGETPLDTELVRVRQALDMGTPLTLPVARAHAAELALRAAAALIVHDGGRAILADHHGQRLAREALFLLVFGSRSSIRDALLGELTQR